MKGPGIKDYLTEIDRRKQEGISSGVEYIEITSKYLHEDLSTGQITMPTCCQAMYKRLLKGDQILQLPKGSTGYGSYLTVRYYLHDLNSREAMIERKPRGRPKKYQSEEERPSRNKSWKTDKLVELLCRWMGELGCEIQHVEEDIIHAYKSDGTKWILRCHGVKRGRKRTLVHKINSLFSELEDDNACYSLVLNDMACYREQWEEIPPMIKEKLNLSVIIARKNGLLEEL